MVSSANFFGDNRCFDDLPCLIKPSLSKFKLTEKKRMIFQFANDEDDGVGYFQFDDEGYDVGVWKLDSTKIPKPI